MGREKIVGKELEEKIADVNSAFDKLEKIFAAYGGEYLTGDNYTLADLSIQTAISNLINKELFSLDDRESLKAWYTRCAEQKGAIAYQDKVAELQAAKK